jgi:Ca2+-binding EF-hand superfamily protein
MKSSVGKVFTVAIATVVCGGVLAQEAPKHDEMSGRSTKDPIQAEMKLMDTNQDGKISAAEHAEGAQQMFQGMDANQDNRVTAAEMDATQPTPNPAHGAQGATGKRELSSTEKIKALDTNGDGALTAQEHAAGSKKMFTKMDGDKDGNLNVGEIRAGHQTLMMSKDE